MASAVLASHKESIWVPKGEIPCPNAHINSNTNPNRKKKQKQFHHSSGNGVVGRYQCNYVESPTVTQAVSGDAHSFNQTSASRNAFDCGSYLTYNVATYTKSELIGLRKRLSSELDQIRGLRERIESERFGIAAVGNPRSQSKSRKVSSIPLSGLPLGSIKSYNGLHDESDGIHNGMENAIDFRYLLKECKQILTKLLKHKCGWIFKSPVDAKALKLYDYHQIVKRPMDLGTVKANITKNLYSGPVEFAADARLTFNNALLYNPKTDPVNGIAEQMLTKFEELFAPVQQKIDERRADQQREREFRKLSKNRFREAGQFQGSFKNNRNQNLASTPLVRKMEKSSESPVRFPGVIKKHEVISMPTQAHSNASTASNPPTTPFNPVPIPGKPNPVITPCLPVKEPKIGRAAGAVKQQKIRARDQNKREMSMEEKQKLVIGLQSVPQEKMPQLVHILKKRNEHLAQEGDEIELDIEALDAETLWELDRLVTNSKMTVSKVKCQAALTRDVDPVSGIAPTTPVAKSVTGFMDDVNVCAEQILKENEDENVDIDDDMPATSFPPVEIEKDDVARDGVGDHDHDGDNASSSSSSSSGSSSDSSSSSSDSDSGSSSGSDSAAADDAHS